MLTAIEVRNAKPKDKPYKLTDGKGLHLLIEAFILLKQRGNLPGLRLRVGGAKTSVDESGTSLSSMRL